MQGKGKKVTPYDAMYMTLLRSQGYTLEQVGKMMGFDKATVSRHSQDISLPKKNDRQD